MENVEKSENGSSQIASESTLSIDEPGVKDRVVDIEGDGESFIVESHKRVVGTLGLETGLFMAERVFAADSGEFQAVQIVSGSDSSEAGKSLAMELMQYEHYRRAFIDSALTYYDEMPDQLKPSLEVGLAVANEIIKQAELKFGALPPLAEPTKRELKSYLKLYGSRITLREMPELMLPGGASVVEGTDEKFGYLGVLSEDGFDSAMDRAVFLVHEMEQDILEQNKASSSENAVPESAERPATKKTRTPRSPAQPAPKGNEKPEKNPRVSRTKAQEQALATSEASVSAAVPNNADTTAAVSPAIATGNLTSPTAEQLKGAEAIVEQQPSITKNPSHDEPIPAAVATGEEGRELTPDERKQLQSHGWTDDQMGDIPADQARSALAAYASTPELSPVIDSESVVQSPIPVMPSPISAPVDAGPLPFDEPLPQPAQVKPLSSEVGVEAKSEVDSIWVGPRRGVDEPQPASARIDKDLLLSRLDSKLQDDKSVLYTLDGEPAFVDRGMRLEMVDGASQSDEKVLAALLTAAQYYHGRIELTGSDAFQRKAIGLIAQYQPNVTMKKPDQQMLLVEARKALQVDPAEKDVIHGDTTPDLRATAQAPAEPGTSPAANTPNAENASTGQASTAPHAQFEPIVPAEATKPTDNTTLNQAKGAAESEPIPSPGAGVTKTKPSDIHESSESASKGVVGKVLGSGDAPFQFDEKNTQSTYITLRTKTGVQTYWGKELAGLLRDTRVTPGKVVTLQWLGKEPVTISVPIKDDKGCVKGFEKKDTHRNQWSLAVLGGAAVRTGQDEGVKLVAYDANRFAQVQQTILSRLRLDIPLPATPTDGLYWMTPDGQGSFKSGDGLTAPRPPADNAVAGHPVMSSYSKDGHLDMALFRGDGPFLQGIVRQKGEFQHVLVSLPNRDDSPPMVFNALTPTCLAPIGAGNGINASGGQPVSRENIAFRIDGDSAVRIGKLDKPAELPPSLHSRLGFDERWRDDNTLPKSAPAAAPTVQPSEPRPA